MAKKKKSVKKGNGRKSAAKAVPLEKSPFWALSGAILLMVLAFLLLLGGFGTGGPLPVNLFHGAYWALGWIAYLTPVALVYWGVHKLKSGDKQIPVRNFGGMAAVLVFRSALAYVAFASKDSAGKWQDGH